MLSYLKLETMNEILDSNRRLQLKFMNSIESLQLFENKGCRIKDAYFETEYSKIENNNKKINEL